MVYLHPDEPGVYIYLGFGFGLVGCDLGRFASRDSWRPDSDYIEPILGHISVNIDPILLKLVPLDRSHPPGAVHVQIWCLELHPEQPGVKPDSLILTI